VALPRADVNLVRVPSDVESDVAASLGCRFATAYRAVAQVAGVNAGDNVVVHGCGGVGLSAIMVAVALGARVLAVDVAPASLELAEQLGALPVAANDVAGLPDLTDGGADVSLDAFGSRATLSASVACLRPRGRHVQVGLLGGDDAAPRVDMSRVVAQELQLLGSHGMAASAYPEMLALVAAGRLRPQQLLRERISLEEAGPRLARLGEPGAGTGGITVIRPDLS
jgi:alcohol dehydrogenase